MQGLFDEHFVKKDDGSYRTAYYGNVITDSGTGEVTGQTGKAPIHRPRPTLGCYLEKSWG